MLERCAQKGGYESANRAWESTWEMDDGTERRAFAAGEMNTEAMRTNTSPGSFETNSKIAMAEKLWVLWICCVCLHFA